MKKTILALALAAGLTTAAKAGLTSVNNGLMVNDSTLNVTWANFVETGVAPYSSVQVFLNQLNASNYGGYSDWTTPGNANISYLMLTELGYNQQTQTYVNLASSPFAVANSDMPSGSVTFQQELGGSTEWTGTGYNSSLTYRWGNADGQLSLDTIAGDNDLIVMRDGLATDSTATVPEPSQVAASLLLVAGIAGFVIVRRRKTLVA